MVNKNKIVRAKYDEENIIVYQAYNKKIADSAIKKQTFISPPFKKERMTWIKPSFLWMMYRSGWATKKNQENILAIAIKREGFECALKNASLATFDENIHSSYDSWRNVLAKSDVRVQWDPERDILLQPLNYRCIQIGLSGFAVEKFISDWIVKIQDITEICKEMHSLVLEGKTFQAIEILPSEKVYPLPSEISNKIGISD